MDQDNDTIGRMPLPVEADIMQLARFGEIQSIQDLLDNKVADVNAKDEEGVTPLHVGIHSLNIASTYGADVSMIVGCHQESLCSLQGPDRRRSQRQCDRRRCTGHASAMGSQKL